jgi:uncharacterized membrane protein
VSDDAGSEPDQPDQPDQPTAGKEETEPGERKRPSQHPLVRSGFLEYDRVVFFSDAVFAIAITLLAIDLVPHHAVGGTTAQLHQSVPAIRSFGISFVVIALFWLGHHGIFRYITSLDRTLIGLNLLFLGAIAFLPYPTALLNAAAGESAAVIFYACCGAFAGLVEAVIWIYAVWSPAKLAAPGADQVRMFYLLRILRVPVIFLLSIPIAIVSPTVALFFWILIWVSAVVINRLGPNLDPQEQVD